MDPAYEPFFLSDPLSDRVIRILRNKGEINREQVEEAWMRWLRTRRDGSNQPLWREMTQTPAVNVERIYAVAAHVYGFREIEVNVQDTLILVGILRERLTDAQCNAMVENMVLPVVEDGIHHNQAPRMAFATYDPTRTEIRQLVESFPCGPREMRYVPESTIRSLTERAFPDKKFLIPQQPYVA